MHQKEQVIEDKNDGGMHICYFTLKSMPIKNHLSMKSENLVWVC